MFFYEQPFGGTSVFVVVGMVSAMGVGMVLELSKSRVCVGMESMCGGEKKATTSMWTDEDDGEMDAVDLVQG